MVTVTDRIDEELKQERGRFCEGHGLKRQAVMQEALCEIRELPAKIKKRVSHTISSLASEPRPAGA